MRPKHIGPFNLKQINTLYLYRHFTTLFWKEVMVQKGRRETSRVHKLKYSYINKPDDTWSGVK
jgi:hypothetical protein